MNVDYTEQNQQIYISDDIPLQTIQYAVIDVFKQKVYFTIQAERYIRDSRSRKVWQRYLLNYLDRIPLILRDPAIVILDADDFTEKTYLYYREIYITEFKHTVLFALVVRANGKRIVYNLHPQETGRVKTATRKPAPHILYLKSGVQRKDYF